MNTDSTFRERAVLVTGAARGIGRATAEHFAAAGALVALVDLDGDEVGAAAKVICGHGRRAIPVTANVADAGAVRRAVAACVEAFGRLDVLVNNAGIHFARRITEYTDDEIDHLYNSVYEDAMELMQVAPERARQATHMLFAAHHLERLGDRVTNIGEDVVFLATGQVEDLNP